jgi:hypothetical protein
MTASIIPNAKNQFVDINGSPLVGGFVYFYEVGTLVPKNTWTDSAQTSLNTNPVVLDSRGQAIIYGTGAYRQILTDSLGNTIWDQTISGYEESVFGPQQTIASATTTNLGSLSSNNALITGVTTITSFGTSASLSNPIYFIQFGGILQITYNATSMVIPGAANLTTTAGASALVEVTNAVSGYWRVIAYFSTTSAGSFGTAANQNTGTSGANVPLLNGNNVWSGTARFQKQTYGDEVALTVAAGASTPDFALSNNFTASVGVNYTMNNPANVQPGQSGVFVITQTVGALTMTWGGSYKSPGGIATVSLSGVNGAIDHFAYYAHSSSFIVITPILNPT